MHGCDIDTFILIPTPEWLTFIFVAILCVFLFPIAALGWFEKGENLVKRWSWLDKRLSHRRALGILLLGVITLLTIDGVRLYETDPVPVESPKYHPIAPLAPIVLDAKVVSPKPQMPANSVSGKIETAPCSAVQQGGSNNQANVNCTPPPLILTVTPLGTQESTHPGWTANVFRVTPNRAVPAPFRIYMEFDKPLEDIGCFVPNAGANMGGGPFNKSMHAMVTCGTGFGPDTPLEITAWAIGVVHSVGPATIK